MMWAYRYRVAWLRFVVGHAILQVRDLCLVLTVLLKYQTITAAEVAVNKPGLTKKI